MNLVCSAQLETEKSFSSLLPFADRVYNHRPTMLLFKRSGVSIMVFTSMKCRVMGLPQSEKPTLDRLVELQRLILTTWAKEHEMNVIHFKLTTSTMTHKLPSAVNFYKNEHCLHFDLELFCAAKFLSNDSCHVNVFHSGHVIVTGLKSEENMHTILTHLYRQLNYK